MTNWLALVLIAAIPLLAAADPYDEFPREAISSFRAKLPPLKKNESGIDLSTELPPLMATGTFTGRVRKLHPDTKTVLEFYEKILPQNLEFEFPILKVYRKEIEVREKGKLYWIAIQVGQEADFMQSIQKGEEFALYLRYFGRYQKHVVQVMVGFGEFNKQ